MELPVTPQRFDAKEALKEWLEQQNCSVRPLGLLRYGGLAATTDDWEITFHTGDFIVDITLHDLHYGDQHGRLGPYETQVDLSHPDSFETLKEILTQGCEALGFVRGCLTYWYEWDEMHSECQHDRDFCRQSHEHCFGTCRTEIE